MSQLKKDNSIERLIPIRDKFMLEFDTMRNANGCGVGWEPPNKKEWGIKVYFESKEQLDRFPFKGERYEGVIVYRVVIGRIIAY
jgi:hypothetical protein